MMTNYNDELQRCLDEDLTDEEMSTLFSQMAKDAELRKDFRSLLALKSEFHRIRDGRTMISPKPAAQRRMPMSGILGRRLSVSVPALALVCIMLVIGAYSLFQFSYEKQIDTRYVYVMEMPAYVVQSSAATIKSN